MEKDRDVCKALCIVFVDLKVYDRVVLSMVMWWILGGYLNWLTSWEPSMRSLVRVMGLLDIWF